MAEEIKSGDNGDKLNPEPQGQKAEGILGKPEPVLTLIIKYNTEDGGLAVQGPGNGKVYDEPMCDWMMKKATRHIEIANIQAMKSRIIPSNPSMAQQVRNMFNKNRRR